MTAIEKDRSMDSAEMAAPSLSISKTPISTSRRNFFVDSSCSGSLPDSDDEQNKRVCVEVKLTAEQLKEMMKCKPSKEWVSKAGISLKHSFPELARAYEADAKADRAAHLKVNRLPVQPIPFDVKYNSLCNWKAVHTDDRVYTEYMVLIKHILLRESSLRRLAAAVENIDMLYWKYAAVIINRLQFDRSILTDDVQVMLMRLSMQHEELAVAIAHHRSLTVDVVECVKRWRRVCQKRVSVGTIPSVFFENRNYLMKMASDTQAVFRTQTMKMWLGFEPNMFMIPPRGHDPHAHRLEREGKRREWFRRREAWMQVQLEHLRGLTGSNTVNHHFSGVPHGGNSQQLAGSQSLPLITRSRGSVMRVQLSGTKSATILAAVRGDEFDETLSSVKSFSNDGDDTDDSAGMRAGRNRIQEELSEDEGSRSVDGSSVGGGGASYGDSLAASSSTYSEAEEEWRELRNNCFPSWGSDEDPDAKTFWDNFDLNPLLVEAAVGFVDAFPSIYLVPPMSLALVNRCCKCEAVICDEEQLVLKTERMRADCHQLRDDILLDEQLQKALAEFDSNDVQARLMCEQLMLKTRQEKNKMRDILHYQEIRLQRKAAGAKRSRHTTSRPSTPVNPFSVFLTTTDDRVSDEVVDYKVNVYDLRFRVEDKVEKDRNRLRRIGNALVMVKDKQLRQGKSTTVRPKRMNTVQAAIRLQALVRGALTRSRLKRRQRAMVKMASVMTLQRVGRGFLAKLRAKVEKKNYRREMLLLRKSINRRNQASNIIIYFMRYVVFLARRARYLRKYDMELLASREPERHKKILNAIVRLQKVYRGHKQRLELTKWTQQMRSRRYSARQSYKFIDLERKTHNFTIAGSGGFKFRKKNKSKLPKVDPKIVKFIQEQGDYFQLLIASDVKKNEEDVSVDVSSLELESTPDITVKKLRSRRIISCLPSERTTVAPPKKAVIGPNTFGSSVVSTKSVLRAVRSKERTFIIDKHIQNAVPRSTNDAYINPNVHVQSYLKPVVFTSSSTSCTDDKELTSLLRNVYG
mmetsp:Transcript_14432/g.21688  ORF Transcript_14432/g.21688 Transcript_14432/m.21688 type:complete len:1029 (-) Transcript_14432:193-3279(-)